MELYGDNTTMLSIFTLFRRELASSSEVFPLQYVRNRPCMKLLTDEDKTLKSCFHASEPEPSGDMQLYLHKRHWLCRVNWGRHDCSPNGAFCACIWGLTPLVTRFLEKRLLPLNEPFEHIDEWYFDSGDRPKPRKPIEVAAFLGDKDTFELLQRFGADFGDSLACALTWSWSDMNNNLEMCQYYHTKEQKQRAPLMRYIMESCDVDWRAPDVLLGAVLNNRLDIVCKCLDCGADVHLTWRVAGSIRETLTGGYRVIRLEKTLIVGLLDVAVRIGYGDIAELLLEHGAKSSGELRAEILVEADDTEFLDLDET